MEPAYPAVEVPTFGQRIVSGANVPKFDWPAGFRLNAPLVGLASTRSRQGYWAVSSDGGVFSFGDATFQGSTGGQRLNRPIIGMAADPFSDGYWLFASDGGVFSFGAPFMGSTGNIHLNAPIVSMVPSVSGRGYWLIASDGGVFSFGDARFSGSLGAVRLNKPIVSAAADRDGTGYWLLAEDGGVFAFDAPFFGAATGYPGGGQPIKNSFVAITAAPNGDGYCLFNMDNSAPSFGTPSWCSVAWTVGARRVITVATHPNWDGKLALLGPELVMDCDRVGALCPTPPKYKH